MITEVKKVLMISIYPNSIVHYMMAPYVLKAFVYNDNIIKSHYSIDIENYCCECIEEKESELQSLAQKYDIICYSVYTWNVKYINKINKIIGKDKICIFGGPEINDKKMDSSPTSCNYYIIGEGEEKFQSLLYYLLNNKLIKYGHYIWDSVPFEKKIDVMPIYSSGIIPIALYKHRIAYLESQRGCYNKCSYCNYGKKLKKINYFDIDVLLNEIEYIVKVGVKEVRFIDPVFTSNRNRANIIIDKFLEMKEKGITIPRLFLETEWEILDETFLERVSLLKNRAVIDNIKTMQNVNMAQIYTTICKDYNELIGIGIQSLNKESLKAVKRKTLDINRFEQFMGLIVKKNLMCKFDIILGLPCETVDSFWKGIQCICKYLKNNDSILNIHILKIVPNTELYNSYVDYGIKKDMYTGNVLATSTIREDEMIQCKVLIAILFRVINSPLRSFFFAFCEKRNLEVRMALTYIFNSLEKSIQAIITNGAILEADEYWNGRVYSELSYTCVMDIIK